MTMCVSTVDGDQVERFYWSKDSVLIWRTELWNDGGLRTLAPVATAFQNIYQLNIKARW